MENVALIKKELIVREDIWISILAENYPDVFRTLTPTIFALNEGYTINGLEHVVLMANYTDYFYVGDDYVSKEAQGKAHLQGFYCPYFVGHEDSIPDNIWMRLYHKEDGYEWADGIFKFTDRFNYMRPNIWILEWNHQDEKLVTHVDYYSMMKVPLNHLQRTYTVEIDWDFKWIIPIPIM